MTLALLPGDPGVDDGLGVELAGIDVATGKLLWRLPGSFVVLDPPTACPGSTEDWWFCLVLSSSAKSELMLVALDAVSGRVESEISGVTRRLADGLYESGGSISHLVRISFPQGVLWSKSLDAELGSSDYDIDYGWTIDAVGGDYLVSVQARPTAGTSQLTVALTAAIDALTGEVRWREPGSYRCGGAVPINEPFACLETGTLHLSGKTAAPTLSPDATATIIGFDPLTGRPRWKLELARDVLGPFIAGTGYAVSGTRILVRLTGRATRPELLDLATGALSPAQPRELFWCPQLPTFDEQYPGGPDVQRDGVTTWFACTVSGSFVEGVAPVSPSVGILAGGHFIVALAGQLKGLPAPQG
jgi:hypothetical protein